MAIDRFSKERFEAALPRADRQGVAFRRWVRFEGGQYIYKFQLGPGLFIQIYSSVDESGFARAISEDSIRFSLVNAEGKPMTNKTQLFVTRAHGWESRVLGMFWKLWELGQEILTPCGRCRAQLKIFTCRRKDSRYLGCRFTKCTRCGDTAWLDQPKQEVACQ
jgi:hypothetical protein